MSGGADTFYAVAYRAGCSAENVLEYCSRQNFGDQLHGVSGDTNIDVALQKSSAVDFRDNHGNIVFSTSESDGERLQGWAYRAGCTVEALITQLLCSGVTASAH